MGHALSRRVIRIDVEGRELAVLNGARGTLSDHSVAAVGLEFFKLQCDILTGFDWCGLNFGRCKTVPSN